MPESSRKPKPKLPAGLFYEEVGGKAGESFRVRWDEVRKLADLRATDHVLDVGCAEGLIALEVAGLAERVHGFDISEERVALAARLADDRGASNATFEVASAADFRPEPLSYDVVLVLGVWGERRGVGGEQLRRFLGTARRQVLVRANVQDDVARTSWLVEMLSVCEECGFDALCFSKAREKKTEAPRGNLLVANRRGTDARIAELPGLALVPTALLHEHPVVRSAASGGPAV